MVLKNLISSFTAYRVNQTTFAIVEDDAYREHPIIYVKIHPRAPVIIITDTGCDAPSKRSRDAKYIHLRDFLEHCPVDANGNQPLNFGGCRSYIIICTHCHYDHIGGIEQFAHPPQCIQGPPYSDFPMKPSEAAIVASARGQDFILKDLPTHSLCKYLGIPTPKYEVTCWAADDTRLAYRKEGGVDTRARNDSHRTPAHMDLGIVIFNTPGHTPDELAWYDRKERHLYVGDSFYQLGHEAQQCLELGQRPGYIDDLSNTYNGPIIFPTDGNWIDYIISMHKLLRNVQCFNKDTFGRRYIPRVKVSCGHTTSGGDAEDLLKEVIALFEAIIAGRVPIVAEDNVRGEIHWTWHDGGSFKKWAVRAPKKVFQEAVKDWNYRNMRE